MPCHNRQFLEDHSHFRDYIAHYLADIGFLPRTEVTVETGRVDILLTETRQPVIIEVKIDYWDGRSHVAENQLQRYAQCFEKPFLVAVRLTKDGMKCETYTKDKVNNL